MTRFPIVYKFLDEYTNNFTAWLGMLLAVSICMLMFSLMNRLPEVIALFKPKPKTINTSAAAGEKRPSKMELKLKTAFEKKIQYWEGMKAQADFGSGRLNS